MKKIIFGLTFFCSVLYAENKVIFFRLLNNTKYQGPWNLSTEITDLLAKKLSETRKFRVFPQSFTALKTQRATMDDINDIDVLIKFAKRYRANIVLTGVIKKFDLSSSSLFSPDVGGYKVDFGELNIEYQLVNVSEGKQFFYEADGKKANHDLGLTFFGGPGGSEDLEDKTTLEKLEKLKFGSVLFNQSVLGEAVNRALDQIVSKMLEQFPTTIRTVSGKVIDIDGKDIYINLGSKQNILQGQRFVIYRRGKVIMDEETKEVLGYREIQKAKVEVARVLAAKLSKVKILGEVEGKVEIGDRVKFYEIKKSEEP